MTPAWDEARGDHGISTKRMDGCARMNTTERGRGKGACLQCRHLPLARGPKVPSRNQLHVMSSRHRQAQLARIATLGGKPSREPVLQALHLHYTTLAYSTFRRRWALENHVAAPRCSSCFKQGMVEGGCAKCGVEWECHS